MNLKKLVAAVFGDSEDGIQALHRRIGLDDGDQVECAATIGENAAVQEVFSHGSIDHCEDTVHLI